MKLHLGCGSKYIPGWTHVDVVDYPHIDIRHSIDNLPMIANETVDVIYACHVLEHFMRREVGRVLVEWHRIIRPGGVLRVAVPDFDELIDLYKDTGDLSHIIGPLFGRQDYLYNFHYMVYDYKTLSRVLCEAGFLDVRVYDWRKTEHAFLDDFSQSYWPHMDKEKGTLLSLNVEATK